MKKIILLLLLSISVSSCIVVVPQSNLRKQIKEVRKSNKGKRGCTMYSYPEKKKFSKVKVWKKQYR
jgi:hypothetical protein